jgi:hypothetical protein
MRHLLIAAMLLAASALPATAQVIQQPGPIMQGAPVQQGYPYPTQGYPQQAYPQTGCPNLTTPPVQVLMNRMMRRLAPANLAPQQQSQISAMVQQFAQTHPAGSPVDRQGMMQLRRAVQSLLAPQQIQALQAARAARMQYGQGQHMRVCH